MNTDLSALARGRKQLLSRTIQRTDRDDCSEKPENFMDSRYPQSSAAQSIYPTRLRRAVLKNPCNFGIVG